jgi:cysteine desulfurase/selenocysteine lyase
MVAERFIVKDISDRRSDFPILKTTMNGKPLVYLDSASSAQKPSCVIDAMISRMEGCYSNIHRGLYSISQVLTEEFEAVRRTVSTFIGAQSENEIVFTRNTTDAINLVAQSWGRTNLHAGDEVIISAMEHHANIVPWQILRDQIGIVIKIVPIDTRGVLDLDAYGALLSDKTKLVSLVHISNSLGTINPVAGMIKTAKSYNSDIVTLVDGSQSVVHMPINVRAIGCDFFVFTGHKTYGPTGIGALYGRYDVLNAMPPYQGGGDMIDRVTFDKTTYREAPFRFEAGTPPILEVIGLGAALNYMSDIGMDAINAHESELLAYGTDLLSGFKGLTIHGTSPDKAGVLSFTVDYAHTSDIGMVMDQCGVAVRTGHHCCMPLMDELGVDSTVRASIGLYTNKADLDALAAGLQKAEGLLS